MLATHPGKTKLAVSLSAAVAQLKLSSTVPLSAGMIRDILDCLCAAVPWFVRVVKLGCTSSQSKKENTPGGIGNGGKAIERVVKDVKNVEGLLIFAKRDGEVIGREEVLKEFRVKRQEWEKQT
jgi:hypothetical protein